MADELIENAEFGRKNKNEEDPILVAQRFLNIYRQMHIFNKERQNQFDDMLMELPPDVRILLSTLPGGSLLLEHIEEVEQKRGLISALVKKESSFRKKNNQDLAGGGNAPNQENRVAGGVVIDSSFASELSSSLSLALQQTEKRYKDDIKTLTETITQSIMASQSAIANMMKDVLIASRSKGFSGNDNVLLKVAPGFTDGGDKSVTENNNPLVAEKDVAAENTLQDSPSEILPMTESEEQPTAEKSISPTEDVREKAEDVREEKASGKKKGKKGSKEQTTENTVAESLYIPDEKPADNLLENTGEESLTAETAVGAAEAEENVGENPPFNGNVPESFESAENNLESDDKGDGKITLNFGKISALANDLAKKIGKNKKNKKPTEDILPDDTILAETDNDNPTLAEGLSDDNPALAEAFSDDNPALAEVFPDDNPALAEETPNASDDNTALDVTEESDSEKFSLDSLLNDSQEKEDDILDLPQESSPEEAVLALPENESDNVLYTEELSQIRKALQESKTETESKAAAKDVSGIEISEELPTSPAQEDPQTSDSFVSLDDLPDTPVSLDDISEEPISLEDFEDNQNLQTKSDTSAYPDDSYSNPADEQDWEWEYVDDNGNSDDEDWEWEYVEDDGSGNNSEDWEWEYVEDDDSTGKNNNQ